MEKILEQYIPMAEMIAKTFGDTCEVVLHDLSTPQSSVVYAANGHVTGRKVGQSFDHLIRQVILNQNFSNDYAANYYFQTEDGRTIKSSTVLIRNFGGKVAGALCINVDTTVLAAAASLLSGLLPGMESGGTGDVRVEKSQDYVDPDSEMPEHIMEIADELIEKIIGDQIVENMKRDEKIALIRFMDQKGLFLIKGTIEKVAKRMEISKVTVYSYLDEIKEEKSE